jgi:acyl-coenzyme A thioesterase PaaI-like protein
MSSRSIHKLLDFIRLSSRLEGTPGFSPAALGLSYDHISQLSNTAAVSFDESSKTLKLRFPLEALPKRSTSPVVSLSTYMAMMDDVTTWALVLADSKRSRAGISVSLQAAWNPTLKTTISTTTSASEQVVLFTAAVKKIGRNIGFVGAEIRDAATNELLCFGSHIKYMPMGPLTDFALSSTGWELTKLYSEHILSVPKAVDTSTDLFESFRLHKRSDDSSTMASFTPSKVHASLGGPIHGGCQAVLMEMAAQEYVKQQQLSELDSGFQLRLHSMAVEYMSPPKSKQVHLKVENIDSSASTGQTDDSSRSQLSLRVQLAGGDGDGRAKSEGLLNFVRR